MNTSSQLIGMPIEQERAIDAKILAGRQYMPKELQVWKPLSVGQRVRSNCRYRRGEIGTVKERLDDRIDGMARYGITLDSNPNSTADFCRHELVKADGK